MLDPKSEARISLTDADPDLLRGLDESSAQQVRAVAHVTVLSFEPGRWEPSIEARRALYGLFVSRGCCAGRS